LLNGNFSAGQNYQDFGVKLTKGNIEFHLTKLKTEREIWRKTHPQDVTKIEALTAH
jgi:16S rRNA G527 N7-methylase RsmG